jgi:putative transposase
MGCARLIWNAKCEDERYMTIFARKYYPMDTYAPINQTYSQYKNKELTPWLFSCPSQILRNSAVNWYDTYWKFIKGECGKPKRKPKSDTASIYLTRELFKFEIDSHGTKNLFIGIKTNNIGNLSIKCHRKFTLPNSITIRRDKGKYYVSFCFGEKQISTNSFNKDNLKYLRDQDLDYLNKHTVGIDRGIAIAVQTPDASYDLTANELSKKRNHERYIKQLQRKLARQSKTSNRRKKTKYRLANRHQKIFNIRDNFCHQTSHSIVSNPNNKIIILEDLKTKNLSRSSKGSIAKPGKNVKAKSGLNRAILDKGWYKFESYLQYKTLQKGKAFFKVNPMFTSQECANCGNIHPDNRKTQKEFVCVNCNHSDNADRNAAINIKNIAIKLIKHSGTELSNKGVIALKKAKTSKLDKGRGATDKTSNTKVLDAHSYEPSKKKIQDELCANTESEAR